MLNPVVFIVGQKLNKTKLMSKKQVKYPKWQKAATSWQYTSAAEELNQGLSPAQIQPMIRVTLEPGFTKFQVQTHNHLAMLPPRGVLPYRYVPL